MLFKFLGLCGRAVEVFILPGCSTVTLVTGA